MASEQILARRVGDRVTMRFGGRDVTAQIIEDRGPIGVGGSRLYHVEIPMEPYEPLRTVASEEELMPYSPPPRLAKAEIVGFLVNGGLMHMLGHDASDEAPPRVWLRRDNAGGVTFTTRRSLGEVGGAEVPVFAFTEEHIFSGKAKEVSDFLMSFGLTRSEAESVIRRIGTEP